MTKTRISIIILTKNEEKMIKECLSTISWSDETIVVDAESSDKTVSIARGLGAKVYINRFKNFAQQRNFACGKANGDWLFFIDADERVSSKLSEEIKQKINNQGEISAFQVPRLNIFFGKPMHHGGWYPDYQTKLFRKDSFKCWFGQIHESPKIEGKVGSLKNFIIHLSHRSIYEGFEKSIVWTKMEADLFFEAKHPLVSPVHFFKVPFCEFFRRIIWKKGLFDGEVGWLEGLIQAFNKFLIYSQLWEKQQNIGH